jgi:hypothetical protein
MIASPRRPHDQRGPRALVLALAALVACSGGGPSPAAPAAPNAPSACGRASDNMIAVLLDRLPKGSPPPTETADAFRNAIRDHCERDGWSAAATRCLIAMKQLSDAEPCAKLMTEDQQAALANAELAEVGGAPVPGSGGLRPDAGP